MWTIQDSGTHFTTTASLYVVRWCNKREIFTTCEFKDYSPRKGFKCEEYFNKLSDINKLKEI